ncbi:uncharacterized protein ACRADG_010722 isoform 2-T2 [Cochliomyia hominivorax]
MESRSFGIYLPTDAAIYSQRYFRDEKYPGNCVVEDKVLKPGQSTKHPASLCAKVTCANSIGLATVESCDPLSSLGPALDNIKNYEFANLKPKCEWGYFKNLKADYPICCERYIICEFEGKKGKLVQ